MVTVRNVDIVLIALTTTANEHIRAPSTEGPKRRRRKHLYLCIAESPNRRNCWHHKRSILWHRKFHNCSHIHQRRPCKRGWYTASISWTRTRSHGSRHNLMGEAEVVSQ
jgi:hypothetical protein